MNIPYQKILVTLDGSDCAKHALPHAELLAKQTGAELILLRITPLPNPEAALIAGSPLDWSNRDAYVQRLVDDATVVLQELAGSLRFQHIKATPVVDVGEAAEKIVDYAERNAIDLIVMSTHGRTGLRRWLMGSVANKVSSVAPCPVLLVRPS